MSRVHRSYPILCHLQVRLGVYTGLYHLNFGSAACLSYASLKKNILHLLRKLKGVYNICFGLSAQAMQVVKKMLFVHYTHQVMFR